MINLNECVIGALDFLDGKVPSLDLGSAKRPLVVGSGNALVTGRILLEEKDAIFADEGNYHKFIDLADSAIVISASGAKHAPGITKELSKKMPVHLLTCNEDASAKQFAGKVTVFPSRSEPYTYNTSTYMGMILSKTKEDTQEIKDFILEGVFATDLSQYSSFFLIVPEKFDILKEMFVTKFDELFGPKINGRIYTPEQTKHAKTVVPCEKELFISLGYNNQEWGKHRLNIPLPEDSNYASVMAIGYYLIGLIQSHHTPYFKININAYTRDSSRVFGHEIKSIVD